MSVKENEEPPFIEAAVSGAKVGSNASLAGKVDECLRGLARGGSVPEAYFRIHDLNNPAAAYWSRKAPEVEEPKATARRLSSGKRRHKQAGYWFTGLPGFILGEGRVEGAYVGLQGIVGKIDFLIGRSVLEYKTKDTLPERPEVLWTRYPQDIEQTVFYAVLLPNASDTHFLVFDTGGEFRTFRIRVLEWDVLRKLLTHRSQDLREALDRGDPSRLGRCRYYGAGYKFEAVRVCDCRELPSLDMTILRGAVEVTHDVDLETQVKEAYSRAAVSPDEVWWWDLFSPRRRFLEEPPAYISDTEKNAARWLLEEGVRTMRLSPDRRYYEEARAGAEALGIRASSGLLRVMSARSGIGIVPFVARAQHGPVKREWQVTPWFVAELAIACAAADSPRGVLFVIYPDDDSKVAAYDVGFPDLNRVKELVKRAVRQIRSAEDVNDPSLVRECPAFMRSGCSSKCLCSPSKGGP